MTRNFTFLLMALLALAGFKSWGQETLTVCDGMDFHTQVPIYTGYFDVVGTTSQFIIPSTEIAGLQGGSITKLEFYIAGSPTFSSFDYAGLKCSLKEVDSKEINGIVTSGLSTVYEGLLTYTATTMSVTFTTPFAYTGGHLLVSFEVTTKSSYNECYFYGTNTSYVSSYCNQWVNTPISFIPKTTITYTGGSTCPAPTGLKASHFTTTGATISWTGNDAESYDVAYGVASAFDLSNPSTYILQSGLTTTSVQLSGLIAETEYKCAVKAHCSSEEESAWSSAVAFTASTTQHLTVNDGTDVYDKAPIYGNVNSNTIYYGLSKSQFAIPASYIEDMQGCEITQLKFYVNSSSYYYSDYSSDRWDVYITEMDDPSGAWWDFYDFGTMTKVYSGSVSIVNNELTITLDEPFPYNDKSLMIGFNQTQNGFYGVTHWLGSNNTTGSAGASRSRAGWPNDQKETKPFLPKTTFTYQPGATRYNVEVGYPIGGNISANPTSAAAGTTVNLTATPETEFWGYWEYIYEFGEWVEEYDDVEIVNNQFTMPEHDVFISATFNPVTTYDITINNSTGCTVGASYQGYEITKAPAGTIVTLYAYVDSEYLFDYFTVDGIQISGSTFEMPDHEVTISAVFHEKQIYTITLMANGIESYSYQVTEGDRTYAYTYTPYIPSTTFKGVTFEGWSYSEIDPYTTERPETIDEDMVATQNVSLHAVFSYSEDVPVAKSVDGYWSKVTDPASLKEGDKVVFVHDNHDNSKYIMCERSGSIYNGYFNHGTVTVSDNVITSIPDNAVEFTLQSDGDNWKLKYVDALEIGETTLAYNNFDLYPKNYEYGTSFSDIWTAEINSNSVFFRETTCTSARYIAYNNGYFKGNAADLACQVYKAGLPYVTNTYYMTNVLTDGYVEEDTQVKNIIITSDNTYGIEVNRTLELDANGLFRNDDAEKFVFFVDDGAQFIYGGGETVKAKFYKNISAYTNEEGRDGYYLLANPTHNTTVENLDTYQYDLYRFDPAQQLEWINIHPTSLDDDPVIDRETGYLYACSNSKTIEFIGNLLPAGSTEFELEYAEKEFGGFNLLGNPYACNVYLDKPALRLNAAGGEFIPVEGAIAPCEGFFVEATAANQSVTLSTEAPEAPASLLSLSVSQNRGNVIDRAIVNFNGSNNLHKFMLNPDHTNIRLAKNGEEFAAISSEAEGEIPVSFKAEKNGSYTITVNTENVNAHYIHLIDNKTGMDVDLLSTPSYTFNASTTDYAYRFKLVFGMTGIEENENNANSYAYINNGNLVIDHIEGEATMQIVDMLGRVVSTEIVSGSYNKALNLKAGLYIINLNGMTQKIVVK